MENIKNENPSLQIYYLEDLVKEKDELISDKEKQIVQLKEKILQINSAQKKVIEIEIYDALKNEYDSKVEKYEELFEKYDSIRKNDKSHLHHIEKLNFIIDEKESTINQLKKVKEDLKVIKDENLILANAVSELSQKSKKLEEENFNLTESNKALEKENQEISSLLPKKANESFNYSATSIDISNMTLPECDNMAFIKITTLENENEQLLTKKKALEEDIVDLNCKLQNLESENETKNCQIGDLQKNNDILNSQVVEKNYLCEAQFHKIGELQKKFDQLTYLKEEVEKEFSNKSMQIDELHNNINKLSAEIISLQVNIQLRESEKIELLDKNVQQENVICGLRKELQIIGEENVQKNILIQTLQDKYEKCCLIKQKLEQTTLEQSLKLNEFAERVKEFENEHIQFSERVKILQTEADESQQEKKSLECLVNKLEHSIDDVKSSKDEQSTQFNLILKSKEDKLKQLSTDVMSLQTNIQLREREKDELLNKNEQLEQVICCIQKESQILKEEIVQKDLSIQNLQANNEKYCSIKQKLEQTTLEQSLKLDEFVERVKEFENECLRQFEEIKILKIEIEKDQKEKKSLEGTVIQLEKANDNLKSSKDEQTLQYNLLLKSKEDELCQLKCSHETKLTSIEKEMTEKVNINDALVRQLYDQIDVGKTKKNQLTALNEYLNENIKDLTLQIEKEKTVNHELTDSVDKLTHDFTELKSRCEEFQNSNAKLLTEREHLRKQINDKQFCLDETNQKIKSFEIENSNLLSQNKQLTENIHYNECELRNLTCKMKEYEQQYDKLKEENCSLSNQLQDRAIKHENEMKQLYSSTNELSHAMHTKEFAIEELTKLLEKSESQIKLLQADLNSKSDEVDKYRTLCDKLKDETNQMAQHKNQEVDKELESLKIEIRKRDVKIKRIENLLATEQKSFEMERRTKQRVMKENLELEKENRDLKKRLKHEEETVSEVTSESNCFKKPIEVNITNETAKMNKTASEFKVPSVAPSLPLGAGNHFAMADEEGQFMDPNHIDSSQLFKQDSDSKDDRIQTLIYRNSMMKPHLRSAYPVEMQNTSFDENSLRSGSLQSISSTKSKTRIGTRNESRDFASMENIPHKIFRPSKSKDDTKSTFKSLTPSKILKKVIPKQRSWSPHVNNKK